MSRDASTKEHSIKLFDAREYQKGPFAEIVPSRRAWDASARRLEKVLSGPNASQNDASSRQSAGAAGQLAGQAVQRALDAQWNSLQFSTDGNDVLVNTNSDAMMILNAFDAEEAPVLITGRKNENSLSLGSSFSVDGKYVLAGQDENELTVYDSKSGDLVATHSGHTKPIGAIRCNPKYDMVATSCVHMALWLQTDVTANRRNSP
jgi:WD40 repeat protein